MGLFFGASVITVIELVIFLSKLAWIAFSSQRREYMLHKRQKERDREQRLTTVINIAAVRFYIPYKSKFPFFLNQIYTLKCFYFFNFRPFENLKLCMHFSTQDEAVMG